MPHGPLALVDLIDPSGAANHGAAIRRMGRQPPQVLLSINVCAGCALALTQSK